MRKLSLFSFKWDRTLRFMRWCGFLVRRLLFELLSSALRARILQFSKENTSGIMFHMRLLVSYAECATLGEGYYEKSE